MQDANFPTRWYMGWAAVVVCAAASCLAATAGDPQLGAMREDAELADVCFVDAEHGWAVGDRGVVWHTADGGKTWSLQETGVTARLESVFFLDANQGWIVGGTTQPGTHQTSAVLLRTRDGGRHWQAEPRLPLPALKKIKFFNAQVGWALGEPSALFTSGVFTTEDGGRSWAPVPGMARHGWLTGDFIDPNSGALAGRQGSLSAVRRRSLEEIANPGFGLRGFHRMQLDGPGQGWLVGDGALVLTTDDLGTTWQTPEGHWPAELDEHFDWHALAARGANCWIAGTPGTRVLHSPDGGKTWQVQSTGQSLPIRSLAFADPQHGWAVGAMGTILATGDGGRTWQRQRGGGTRAALLAVYNDAHQVPLELFARLAASDGYLAVAELLTRRDIEVDQQREATLGDRGHEAVVAAGGSGAHQAWQFPLRQRGLKLSADEIIAGWDRTSDGQGLKRLEAHLVRQIRLWRPDVVFTERAAPHGDAPLSHMVHQLMLQAVESAGDPTRFTEQLTHAGLEPWKVRKLYSTSAEGQSGTTMLETAQLSPRLGQSFADRAALARLLIDERISPSPAVIGFRLAMNELNGSGSERDFFSGLVLHPGGEARRALSEMPTDGLEQLRRAVQKQRNIEAVLERSEEDPQQGVALAAQMGDLMQSIDGPMAGRLLYQMADRYYRSGQWDLAAETFDVLVNRYPDHPMTPPALVWMVQYWSSGEAAWRSQSRQRINVARSEDDATEKPAARRASALAIDEAQLTDRYRRAVELGKFLESTRPVISAEPIVRFPLAVAYRRQGLPREAERFYMALRQRNMQDVWWACADAERWLADPRSAMPQKSVWPCTSGGKPRLDGRLDDSIWQQAQKMPLASPLRDDAHWPAIAMLAYDEGFLYLAASCQSHQGSVAASEGPRTRDADLTAHDRVEFRIDLDRDYTTAYRLVVDCRGWTAEDLWHDRSWNPRWFVAAHAEEGVWNIEAAIPLEELTGQFPAAKSVWGIGVQRIAPRLGFQSWNTPAAASGDTAGLGLLLFE